MTFNLSDMMKYTLFLETGSYTEEIGTKIKFENSQIEFIEDESNNHEERELIDLEELNKIQNQLLQFTDLEKNIYSPLDSFYISTKEFKTEYDDQEYVKVYYNFNRVTFSDNNVIYIDPYTSVRISTFGFGPKYAEIDPSFHVFGLNFNMCKSQLGQDSKSEVKDSAADLNKYYLFFDVETNGLPVDWNAPLIELDNWPRIVQLAWTLYNSEGKVISQNESIIKPDGFYISTESEEIHGISDTYTRNHGKELFDVLMDFNSSLITDCLVAHNLNFDRKVLGAEYLRVFSKNPLSSLKGICTMKESTEYCSLTTGDGNKWPKLEELYTTLFGVSFENKHNAKYDVQATAKCFWELKKRGVL